MPVEPLVDLIVLYLYRRDVYIEQLINPVCGATDNNCVLLTLFNNKETGLGEVRFLGLVNHNLLPVCLVAKYGISLRRGRYIFLVESIFVGCVPGVPAVAQKSELLVIMKFIGLSRVYIECMN